MSDRPLTAAQRDTLAKIAAGEVYEAKFGYGAWRICGASPTVVGWSNTTTRMIWLGAAGCILAVLAITMAYYAPSNAAFAAKSIPVDQVSSKLDTWLMIHNLRIVLAVAASALGVWAVSL